MKYIFLSLLSKYDFVLISVVALLTLGMVTHEVEFYSWIISPFC